MRDFLSRNSNDLRVVAGLEGKIDREGLLKMRAQIDSMRSVNLRQVALAIWLAKVNNPSR